MADGRKPQVLGDLDVRWVGPRRWQLIHDITFQRGGESARVPAGFLTDFASIPRLLRWFTARDATWARASVVHDFFYKHQSKPRREADRWWLDFAELDGAVWRSRVGYIGLRIGGWLSYRR